MMEVLLALGLAVALAVAGLLAFGGRDPIVFEQGLERFQAALRMARADAANLGRRVRLVFDEEGRTSVLWEPQPLAEPGVFEEHAACLWRTFIPQELVRVHKCQLVGSSAYRTLTFGQQGAGSDEQSVLNPLTFQPDGTGDSALVELGPTDASDTRRAVIRLDAQGGIVSAVVLQQEQVQEYCNQVQRELSGIPEDDSG